jgi:hypothetical protein
MPRTATRRRKQHKERKTFSLGPEYVAFLESLRRETQSESLTAALEEALRRIMLAEEMEKISAEVSAFYSAASPRQTAEESAWGQLGESEFAGDGA